MRTILDLLNEGKKKNEKYYMPTGDVDSIKGAYSQNILNMKTVKEGTATAGAFCNRIMEVAFNSGSIDVIEARTISDIFQRIALDSKHNGAGTSYKDADWYKISQLLIKPGKKVNSETVLENVLSILRGEDVTVDVEKPVAETAKMSSFDF